MIRACLPHILGAIIIICVMSIPASAHASPIPDGNRIVFDILRDGQPFGKHKLAFTRRDDGKLVVDIDIEMSVSLGPIPVFTYDHTNRVIWKDGRPQSFNSRTNDNGDRYRVSAQWQADKVVVDTGQGGTHEGPARAYPSTYWNPESLQAGYLVNTQKGTIQDINMKDHGIVFFQTRSGRRRAYHYTIHTDREVDVWYDAQTRQWIGMEFMAKGYRISYQRRDLKQGRADQ